MPTKLAVFDWAALTNDNLAKLKNYQANGWDVALVGNGLDCSSYKINIRDSKQGMFVGEKQIQSVSVYSNGDTHLSYTNGSTN